MNSFVRRPPRRRPDQRSGGGMRRPSNGGFRTNRPQNIEHSFNNNGNNGYRNNGSAIQKLRMSSLSIPIQKLTLVSYAVNLSKFDGSLASGASHKVPDHIIVDIPEIIGQGCNVATPPVSADDQTYFSTHGIPIPISDDLNTIQTLGDGLHFESTYFFSK